MPFPETIPDLEPARRQEPIEVQILEPAAVELPIPAVRIDPHVGPVRSSEFEMKRKTIESNNEESKKSDGGEPTPPSQEGEPITKPEPLNPQKNTSADPYVTTKPSGDIFDDLAALARTNEDLTPSEKVLTNLTIRKSKRDEWTRCHPNIHAVVNLYESSATRDIYVVLPPALEAMEEVIKQVRLTLSVSNFGEVFVWPVPIPSLRKSMPCHVTAATAAERAVNDWIRIAWKSNDYEVHRRVVRGSDPSWPSEISTPSEMLRFISKSGGFEIIDGPDHPVVRELRGLD